jgi:uncharacterized membrane protein YccC
MLLLSVCCEQKEEKMPFFMWLVIAAFAVFDSRKVKRTLVVITCAVITNLVLHSTGIHSSDPAALMTGVPIGCLLGWLARKIWPADD